MGKKRTLSPFWKGFICGGIAVPLTILVVEFAVKMLVYGEMFFK